MKTKQKTKLLKQAELIEKWLNDTDRLFTQKTATLYATHLDNTATTIDTGNDVYELLETKKARTAAVELSNPIGLTTLGWAAPADDLNDLPPSQHPNRRRVSLFIMVNQAGQMASVLRFQDTPNETTTDDGNAQGDLAIALLHLMKL